jgi:5-methylcytosine-specific restriction endonuclease McrA
MTTPLLKIPASARDPRGQRTASLALRFAVFRRDSYTCQYCGRRAPEFPLHVDHVVAWSRGGKTELANLQTACNECNLGKSDREA